MSAASDWQRVEAALDEILALPQSEWQQACARLAGDDAAFYEEVNSLLAHAGGVDPILDRPMMEPTFAPAAGVGLAPGTRVGAYRILELIGRGGMGEVYRAERADGQYSQQAALKLIRSDFADQPERFQVERQILAHLQHPGIARLLDGGVFDGLPFMVIELVKGLPITELCDKSRLDLTARLRLFLDVCNAVAHAHASLVVHRDIKPGNVLVTDEGGVKLLDFGVAKLLGGAADLTRAAPLTPAYSAPEQLTGGPITTATDVYALGVLLFELLCGELPWKSNGMSFGVAVRRVLNESVALPSRSARDNGRAPVPWSLLRGDLDAIIAGALRKEPEHRYTTVEALREDVARFLRHEPVAAREGARLYVIGRFVRRQRLLVAGVAVLLIVIVAGSIGVAWQAREALQQARRAEREGRKAAAVKDFLIDIFKQSSVQNPGGVEAKKVTAQQLLDVGAQRISAQLRDQPEVREELMDTLADLNDDLGLTDRAEKMAADNLAEMSARTAGRPSVALARLEIRLATTLIDRSQGDSIARGVAQLRKALADLQAVGEGESVEAASASYQLGRAAYGTTSEGKVQGLAALRRALDILTARDPANPLRGDVFDYLARYAKLEENAAEAEHWLNELLAFQTAQGEENNGFAIGDAYFNLADFQAQSRRFDAAERNFLHAIELLTKGAGADHPETADARARLGEMYYFSGRPVQAEPLLSDALRADMLTPQGADNATEHRRILGYLELSRGRFAMAEQLMRQNLAVLQGNSEEELRWGISAAALAGVLIAEGEMPEAHALFSKSLDVFRRYTGETSRAYARQLALGGTLSLADHEPDAAIAAFQRVLKEWPPTQGDLPAEYTKPALGLASAYLDLDRTEDALLEADEVLQRLGAAAAANRSPELEAQSRRLKGDALCRSGRATEAEVELRRAVELRQSLDDLDSPWLAQVRLDLAECLITLHRKAEAQSLIKSASASLSHQPRLRDIFRNQLREAQKLSERS